MPAAENIHLIPSRTQYEHSESHFTRILGIRFYTGDVTGLLQLASAGGLIVVPAAPALVDLPRDAAYREAVEQADFAITDSGFMVLVWGATRFQILHRISGLRFLRALLKDVSFRRRRSTFWVMPSAADRDTNVAWLNGQGMDVEHGDCYIAPSYPSGSLCDPDLLALIEQRQPEYIVLNIGGGVQERLGYYLRTRLSYRPAIICTGAAIAFLSGRQANIPPWADRYILGWLMRIISEPKKFIPRYWKAIRLVSIILRHGRASVVEP